MAQIKNTDFIELDYTGKTKDEGMVFDTTIAKIAKDNNFFREASDYHPVVICVGEKQIVPGIDSQLVGKEVGNEYTFELAPEVAFGKKNPALLQLVPTTKFRKENIMPFPGLQVNIDNSMGIVKTVSGGRTLVDFNHPLSGKNVVYTIKVIKFIEDDGEKVKSVLQIQLGLKDLKVKITEGNAEVEFEHDMPSEIAKMIGKKVTQLVPAVKTISFVKPAGAKAHSHEGHNHEGHEHHDHDGHNHQH